MNRLEKKCLLGSAAMHGLLVVVFLFGSAFLTPKTKPENTLPVLIFIPDILTDKVTSGGGNPNANPAPAPAPAPTPKPLTPVLKPQPLPPAPLPEPPKVKETAKDKAPDEKENGDEPIPAKKVKDNAKTVSRISTNVVKRSKVDVAAIRAQQETQKRYEADLRAYNEYRERLGSAAGTIGKAASGLGNSLSGTGISIEPFGPGGGGLTYANYFQWVMTVYDRAWTLSDDVVGDEGTVKTRITIARDGTILSARTVSASSNNSLNRSIQHVLDSVKSVHKPFPEGAKEDQRTFTINFSLRAKRQTG